jgi:hypothetical protein
MGRSLGSQITKELLGQESPEQATAPMECEDESPEAMPQSVIKATRALPLALKTQPACTQPRLTLLKLLTRT